MSGNKKGHTNRSGEHCVLHSRHCSLPPAPLRQVHLLRSKQRNIAREEEPSRVFQHPRSEGIWLVAPSSRHHLQHLLERSYQGKKGSAIGQGSSFGDQISVCSITPKLIPLILEDPTATRRQEAPNLDYVDKCLLHHGYETRPKLKRFSHGQGQAGGTMTRGCTHAGTLSGCRPVPGLPGFRPKQVLLGTSPSCVPNTILGGHHCTNLVKNTSNGKRVYRQEPFPCQLVHTHRRNIPPPCSTHDRT